MSDLLFAPTPHKQAVAFIKAKPAVAREVFDRMLPEIQGRAFTVSGIESVKVLQKLRDRIADLPAGGDWHKIKAELANEITPYLQEGTGPEAEAAARLAGERRAELLLRTHGFQAYQAAQYQVMSRQKDVFKYWRYQTAEDDKVRPSHAALDKVVLPADDPFWQTHFPPWDFNCRCQVIPLSDLDYADVEKEDASKPIDQRSILTPEQRATMNKSGFLIRGPNSNVDVRPPTEKSGGSGYAASPGSLDLSLADLRGRYDPETFGVFEQWAKNQTLPNGGTVWAWLDKETPPQAIPPATPLEKKRGGKPVLPAESILALAPSRESPVSAALKIKATGPLQGQIQDAVAAVDKVHDDGRLSSVPVIRARHADALGKYTYVHHGAPVSISISATGAWPGLTAVHEIGHLLDHQVLGVAGEFASIADPLFGAFRKIASETEAIQAIARLSGPQRGYLLRPVEVWARAYAQYIAVRSGDPVLLAQLDKIRSGPQPWRQWSKADFAAIAEAIDSIFKTKGWL